MTEGRNGSGGETVMEDHGIVVVDARGTIHLWSSGAERLFGYPATEAVGKSLDLIIPARMRARHWAGFRAAMGHGRSALDGSETRLPVVRQDGTTLSLAVRFVFLRDAGGAPLGAVGIFSPGS